MNQPGWGDWQDLARMWQTGTIPITGADIERMQERQRRRLQLARAAELVCTMLGVAAALWLALDSQFLWVGITTAVFSLASVVFTMRARRPPVPQGSTDLLRSVQDSIDYQHWLAEQLRYGRALGFIALFAVAMSASTQLLRMAVATEPGLLVTVVAGAAISAALAGNMVLAWQVSRRTARLEEFGRSLATGEIAKPLLHPLR